MGTKDWSLPDGARPAWREPPRVRAVLRRRRRVLRPPEGSRSAEMVAAVEKTLKPSLVWLEFQDCAGNTESLLRASRPTVAEVILDAISLDYHETIMAAAGKQAEDALPEDDAATSRTSTSSSSRARSPPARAARTARSAARARCRSRARRASTRRA